MGPWLGMSSRLALGRAFALPKRVEYYLLRKLRDPSRKLLEEEASHVQSSRLAHKLSINLCAALCAVRQVVFKPHLIIRASHHFATMQDFAYAFG